MAIVAHADATAAVTIAAECMAERDGVIATTLALALFDTVIVTMVRFASERSAEKDGVIATTLALALFITVIVTVVRFLKRTVSSPPLLLLSGNRHRCHALIAYCHNAVAVVLRTLQLAAMLQVDKQILA